MESSKNPLIIRSDASSSAVVSPFLFGENLEHTRSDVFMGLSAQLLRNRKFAGKPMACSGHSMEWYPVGEKTFFFHSEPYTRHAPDFYHMSRKLERNAQAIVNPEGGLSGIGQHEIPVLAGKTYEFRLVAKAPRPLEVTVSLTDRGGCRVYASASLRLQSEDWQTDSAALSVPETDPDADLRITFSDPGTLHLGAVSLMPAGHFRGMRRDVIEKLREMGIRILRWPGGNFAGEYCWADGLLPVDQRSPLESYGGLETQPHSLGYDYHEINTDDFVALCREIGAEPFITINPAWNTPEENAAWVEYCNGGPETKYGALRASRGFPEPYRVRFWSLGNEAGYGHMEGENTSAGYCRVARANAEAMLAADSSLCLCSSGPYPSADWAEHAAKPLSGLARLVSLHYYAPSPTYADPARLRSEFEACLASVETARGLLHTLRGQLSENIGISFDEWNTWYAWYRPSSIVDGLFTALMLHMFLQEAAAGTVSQVCHFEAVNEGMIEVRPGGAAFTAAGQAYALLSRHAGGELLFVAPDAAATRKDGVLTVTAVNPSFDAPRFVELDFDALRSAESVSEARCSVEPASEDAVCSMKSVSDASGAKACLYTCDRVAPHTVFEIRETVPLRTETGWQIEMPPHSLLFLQLS